MFWDGQASAGLLTCIVPTTGFLSDNRSDLPKVSVPTLVMQCRDDILAPMAVGEYVADAIPDSRLVVLEANGHCPNLSAPDEVITALESFLLPVR